MAKNLPCDAGGMGSIPGWETRIPLAMGLLSLHSTTGVHELQERSCVQELRSGAAKYIK